MRTYTVSAITDKDLAEELVSMMADMQEDVQFDMTWEIKPEHFTDEAMQDHADWLHWWNDFCLESGTENALESYWDHMIEILAQCAVWVFMEKGE